MTYPPCVLTFMAWSRRNSDRDMDEPSLFADFRGRRYRVVHITPQERANVTTDFKSKRFGEMYVNLRDLSRFSPSAKFRELPPPEKSPETIVAEAAKEFGVTPGDVVGRSRAKQATAARRTVARRLGKRMPAAEIAEILNRSVARVESMIGRAA